MSSDRSGNRTVIFAAIITAIATVIGAYIASKPDMETSTVQFPQSIHSENEESLPVNGYESGDKGLLNCTITIESHGAEILETPFHKALHIDGVPGGEYLIFDTRVVDWAGKDQRWYKIKVGQREGWICDWGGIVKGKSSGCP